MNISQVKKNLGQKIVYKNKEYILTACIIRANEYGFCYQAEIQDLTAASSIIICKLEHITEVKEGVI